MTRERFGLVGVASLFFLSLPAPGRAGLFQTRDARGRLVVTNVRATSASVLAMPRARLSVAGRTRVWSRAGALRADNPAREARRETCRPHVAAAATRYLLPPRLIEAVIRVESDFNPQAVSSKGAQGLMQIMPATARDLELGNPFDPEANIHAGARYLRAMLDAFNQNVSLALAAYNAGPERVRAAGGIPSIPETQEYVRRVRAECGLAMWAEGTSSLRVVRGGDGKTRVTNFGPTASSLRLVRGGSTTVITNR